MRGMETIVMAVYNQYLGSSRKLVDPASVFVRLAVSENGNNFCVQ